ncbi:P4Hc [Seminavis robusta]|uniref:P4Hc n=1 Tax=Seminavis robusta TaxID=568900 RepID=A0A9N8HY90_9STRA|nr:P4Hc [Seminavis robusta]|eukprot:Sro2791_g337180.1 P4Hc (568) ;mRNA; r:3078-4781
MICQHPKTSSRLFVSVLLVCLLGFATLVVEGSSGTSGNNVKRPDWLDVDRVTIQEYMDLARQRHKEAIAKARESYNILEAPGYTPDEDLLSQLHLKPRIVKSSGGLPDFQDELDKKLFVTTPTPLFTAEESQECIDMAEEHFETTNNGEWTKLPSGQYDVAGFWIRDIPDVHDWFLKKLQTKLFPLLARAFPEFCDNSVEDLVVDNAYLFKYTPETGRRTDVHTDSGCLSFTISLNSNSDYQGGGTWFEGLQSDEDGEQVIGKQVIEMDVGQTTVRPGGVRHCGYAVTEGTRYIIGGFCMQAKKVEYVRMLLGIGTQGQNLEERQTALEVAIALNPGFDGCYVNLADVLVKQGNTKKAKQVLEYCLEHVNPQCGEVSYTLGSLLFDEGDLAQAKKCMERCLQVDDSDVDAMVFMSQIVAAEGNKQAEREWNERIVGTPGVADMAAAQAYCNLGVLHAGEDLEIDYYHKSLTCNPESFAPRFSLGCAYAERQQWDEAGQEFRLALEYGGASNDDEEMRAIKALYTVAMNTIKRDHPQGVASRDEMIQLMREIMGGTNFDKLAATSQQR